VSPTKPRTRSLSGASLPEGGFTGEAIAALDRRASFRLSAQSAVCFLIQKSLSVSQANIQEEVNP
jgi:hypothetical protein